MNPNRRAKIVTIAGFLLLLWCNSLVCLSSQRLTASDAISTVTSNSVPLLYGICFSPFRKNESPDCAVFPTKQEIMEDLRFISYSGITKRIRTYSCDGTLGIVPIECQSLGIECWPGAWISRFQEPTEREIRALIKVGQMHLTNCPALIVGNEVLLRKDMDEDTLIKLIGRVKRETGMPVAYAEIGGIWYQHPKVADAVDVMLVHLYPYWDGQNIGAAVPSLVNEMQKLEKTFPNKRIVIGETGWPSAGDIQYGHNQSGNYDGDFRISGQDTKAVPSEEYQANYFGQFIQAARTYKFEYFYFSLFSESWKAQKEGLQGSNWGLFTELGSLKPRLSNFFTSAARTGFDRKPGIMPKPIQLSLPAYVYKDGHSEENRFTPTSWMGDLDDLKINEYCTNSPHSAPECIKIDYVPNGTNGWAGIYWIGPYMNHWGEYPGYSVESPKRFAFWARGEKGGEIVHFSIGGIRLPEKPFSDSFGPLPSSDIAVPLTQNWTQYEIDLSGVDTSSLIGGFCFSVSEGLNPNGCTFYLDDMVIE
jgi:exo-beta-1,3-glucanase (GH17 family)